MTHEYVIALGGIVLGASPADGPAPTAVAWAADGVLAVGSDELVRAISRGDSIFIDVDGCAITPVPSDRKGAEDVVRSAVAAGRPFNAIDVLVRAGLLDSTDGLESGAPADLAFWNQDPEAISAGRARSVRIVASVRAGTFTEGDEHSGPFVRTA